MNFAYDLCCSLQQNNNQRRAIPQEGKGRCTIAEKKPRLHELLAVEQDRKAHAERVRNQTIETFRSGQLQFTGMRRTFKPFAVDEEKGEVAGERVEADTRLVKTVPEELEQSLEKLAEAIDLGYQIDKANCVAKADLVVNGEVLAQNLPATFLLQLEKRLREIRAMLKEAPTFDPVRVWNPDPEADKKHVLRAEPVVTIRKQRTRKYNVMYEATKEHPAQIDIVEIEEPVGEIRSYEWSGMISPGKKAALLEQVDLLISEVKRSRSRANTEEVDPSKKVAKGIVSFLFAPLQHSK